MSIFGKGLPSPVADSLRRLDPAWDHAVASEAELQRMATDLVEHEQVTDLTHWLGEQRPRPRSRAWAAAGGAAAAMVVVGVAVAVLELRPSDSSPAPVDQLGVGQVTAIPAPYRTLAGQTNPLSAGMHVDCNGTTVPVPLLAAPGGAERGTSASSVALRHFLAHNPFYGMGPVTKKNWLLLSRTNNTLTFGQREGSIGVGSVVTLTKKGSSFGASSKGGCGPVIPAPKQSGELASASAAKGTDLDLHWSNESNCGTGPAKTERTLARVLLKQTSTVVHVLLISKPSPDAGPLPPNQACAGVGLLSTTRVHLKAPLGSRTLIDDARVPGVKVRVGQ